MAGGVQGHKTVQIATPAQFVMDTSTARTKAVRSLSVCNSPPDTGITDNSTTFPVFCVCGEKETGAALHHFCCVTRTISFSHFYVRKLFILRTRCCSEGVHDYCVSSHPFEFASIINAIN